MGNLVDIKTQETRSYYRMKYDEARPDTDNKVSYTIKKGDNLWSIAKEKLNKRNAKNSEIQDMMYKIAKLNNMSSIEDANKLGINDVIYLPSSNTDEVTPVSGSPSPSTSNISEPVRDVSETALEINKIIAPEGIPDAYRSLYKYENIKNIPPELYKENGKAGINYWTDILNGQHNLVIQKSYSISPTTPSGLVIMKKENDHIFGKTEAQLMVEFDENGNFKDVAFDTPGVNIYNIKFDYELDANGNLKRPINSYGGIETIDKMKKEEYQQFVQVLQKYVDKHIN